MQITSSRCWENIRSGSGSWWRVGSFAFLYTVGLLRNTSNNWEEFIIAMPKQSKTVRQGQRSTRSSPAIPEGTYLCERILDLKIEDGHRHYLIKWQGYDDPADNTWEPLANLQYLLEDLLLYEETHAKRIRRIEDQWRKMYEEGKVDNPLVELDVEKMQDDLDHLNEGLSNATPESEPPLRKPKTRGISKKQDATPKQKTRKQETVRKQLEEQSNAKKDKETPKRRGRKPQQGKVIAPKLEPIFKPNVQIAISNSEEGSSHEIAPIKDIPSQPENDENIEKEHLFQTPERNISINEDNKKTMSHDRGLEYSEKPSGEEEMVVPNEEVSEDRELHQYEVEERSKINNEINSYFNEFNFDNCVADVLSKGAQVPKPAEPEPAEEVKKDSFFKNVGKNRFDSKHTANPILHGSTKKYIMHHKRKPTIVPALPERINESESESHPIIKPYFQQENPIMEVEEEQKDSTPLASRPSKSDHEDKQEEPEVVQQFAITEQNEQVIVKVAEELMLPQPVEEIKLNALKLKNKAIEANMEEDHMHFEPTGNNNLSNVIDMIDMDIINDNQHEFIQDKPSPKNIINDQALLPKQNQQQEEKSQLDKISMYIENLRKKNAKYIQLEPDREEEKSSNPREVNLISLDQDSSKNSIDALKKRAHDDEEEKENKSKACLLPLKTKRIKKDPKEEKKERGIVGRSEESLIVNEKGELLYRPSLNTLFQSMLSSNELRLFVEPKLFKITSSFKLENIIIFSVQVALQQSQEMRFICYQTMREFFPRELLVYLEENGKIEL